MGRECARRPSGQQSALPAGQYVPNFIWNDTESDGDLDLSTYHSQVYRV